MGECLETNSSVFTLSHLEQLSTKPAHHKILNDGEEDTPETCENIKSDFKKYIPNIFIHVLSITAVHVSCGNYRTKGENANYVSNLNIQR